MGKVLEVGLLAELQCVVDADMMGGAVVENVEETEGAENTLGTCFVTWTRCW
jgi:hypothetical protein